MAKLHHCLRVLLGLLFISSSVIKLTDIAKFASAFGKCVNTNRTLYKLCE